MFDKYTKSDQDEQGSTHNFGPITQISSKTTADENTEKTTHKRDNGDGDGGNENVGAQHGYADTDGQCIYAGGDRLHQQGFVGKNGMVFIRRFADSFARAPNHPSADER